VADTKISALTQIGAVIAATEFAANDGGTSKKATAQQVADFVKIQAYAPGSFTIPTGYFVVMSKQLKLTGSQRLTIQGTGRLRIT
jgi:hypothetical protein